MWADRAIAAAFVTLISASPLFAQDVSHKNVENRPSPWRVLVWGTEMVHARDAAELRPVRFATGLNPAFSISTGQFAKPGGPAPNIPGPRAPKDPLRPYGVFSDIAERVDTIVERYDKMEVRPVSMEDGGGIEYHVTFGAPPRD